MSFAPMQWQSVVMNSGASESAEIDLKRVFDLLQLDIPALNTCSLSLKAARISGGTFNVLGAASPSVDVGVGSKQDVFKIGGHQFLKLVSSVVQNAARTFYYRGIAE